TKHAEPTFTSQPASSDSGRHHHGRRTDSKAGHDQDTWEKMSGTGRHGEERIGQTAREESRHHSGQENFAGRSSRQQSPKGRRGQAISEGRRQGTLGKDPRRTESLIDEQDAGREGVPRGKLDQLRKSAYQTPASESGHSPQDR